MRIQKAICSAVVSNLAKKQIKITFVIDAGQRVVAEELAQYVSKEDAHPLELQITPHQLQLKGLGKSK